MKLSSVALLVVFASIIAASSLADDYAGKQQSRAEIQSSARSGFVLPRLYDFATFIVKFKKHYANPVELARRAKIFIVRASAVFVSVVKYMSNKATSFLKINPRSDRTAEERSAIMNHVPYSDSSTIRPGIFVEPTVADPQEVELKLAELIAHKGEISNQTAKDAALETVRRRARRSADSSSEANLEQIIASNSGDGNSGQVMKPTPDDEARRIVEQAGLSNNMIDSMKGATGQFLNAAWSLAANMVPGVITDKKTTPTEEWIKMLSATIRPNEPDEIYLDYRDTKCILPPKNQYTCGSCYIFVVTALLEYNHCVQTGELVPFSEQFAVDCAQSRATDPNLIRGCGGGFESAVAEFYGQFGVEMATDYPYTGKDGSCPYHISAPSKMMGRIKVDDLSTVTTVDQGSLTPQTIKQLLEREGPLFISIYQKDDFLDYGGGVDVLYCDTETYRYTYHTMALVGHGIEDGLEYWLIRNSHGIEFGLQGHYKMAKVVREGCLVSVGYVRGSFRANPHYEGKAILDQMKASWNEPPSNAV